MPLSIVFMWRALLFKTTIRCLQYRSIKVVTQVLVFHLFVNKSKINMDKEFLFSIINVILQSILDTEVVSLVEIFFNTSIWNNTTKITHFYMQPSK